MPFPYNPNADEPTCLVVNEYKILVAPTGPSPVKYNYLIPRYAPFFLESLQVFITPTAQSVSDFTLNSEVELMLGRDFFPGLEFVEASVQTGREIYGAIVFTDPALAGTVRFTYSSLGGSWLVALAAQNALIAAQTVNPNSADWYSTFGLLGEVPATDFQYEREVPVSFSSLSGVVSDMATLLADAKTTNSPFRYDQHIANTSNPHNTTAASIGLALVPNWPLATANQAINGSTASAFVTPVRAYQAVTGGVVLPPNSSTVYSVARLKHGEPGFGNFGTAAITAAGLIAYKTASGSNPIKSLFNVDRQVVGFSPSPIVYPCLLFGVTCYNFRDLLTAIENHMGLKPIQGSAQRACIYLPKTVTAPSLICTPL